MWINLQERINELPQLLGGHLLLSMSALVIGILISIPLGVFAARSRRWGGPVLTLASLVQTIPSMALLALMVPILGGMIGFLPAFLALTLYSILPVLRNTVTGIGEVDPAMVEAAQGVGMTDWQRLFRVELPLAAPVIIAGIRTATVWVVGTTTLSTPVGAPSLGNYIFTGLQTRNTVSLLFGCVLAAMLAIILDQLIRLAERAARERRKNLGWAAGLGLVIVLVGGLAPMMFQQRARVLPILEGTVELPIEAPSDPPSDPLLSLVGVRSTIGAKTFTEQFILAQVLKRQLEAQGAIVKTIQNMGSTILFDALRNNQVDLYVDYTGTIWTTIMKQGEPIARSAMFIDVASYLLTNYKILVLGRLGFENAYGFAMRRDVASKLSIRSMNDLARHADRLSIGGDPEFFGRPEWIRARDIYRLGAMSTRGMDSTFMYGAVRDGEVDVIGAYTTDGRISAYDLVTLHDPAQAFPPYDAILMLSPQAAESSDLIETLTPLINAIDDESMREANRRVDLDGASPQQAASFLLSRFSVRKGD